MIRQVTYKIKLLLGRDAPGNGLTIYNDDVFLASYPKSGNTWTRFLIANLIHPHEPATFLNIHRIVPDPEWQSRNFLKNLPRPRVIKSHHPFDPRYKRVICIVRDPRDIALSQYHFQIKRGQFNSNLPIESFVQRFVQGETCDYGSWGQNVGSWLIARHNTNGFLLLRYEDLLEHTEEALHKIAGFLALTPANGQLARAIELSSAENMRKLESKQSSRWEMTKSTRTDISFVRTAASGGWKSNLPPSAVSQIELAWGHIMRMLGYETTSSPASGSDSALANALDLR
jgi:Sulfotransferase domain